MPPEDLNRKTAGKALAHLAPIGAGFFDRAYEMERAGFNAFRPLVVFQESFCKSVEEVSEHREYLVERAKERLGNPAPHLYLRDGGQGYRSPFLNSLREKRRRSRGAFDNLDRAKPWLAELTECRLRQQELFYTSSKEFDDRKSSVLAEHAQLRAVEVARFSTELGAVRDDGLRTRAPLVEAVMSSCLQPLGYAKAGKAGGFTKQISSAWQLTWILDRANLHRPIGTREEDQIGYLNLDLCLCHIKTQEKGPVIEYESAAPVDDREWGYGTFRTMRQLEVIVRARMLVFRSIQQELEGNLASALTGER